MPPLYHRSARGTSLDLFSVAQGRRREGECEKICEFRKFFLAKPSVEVYIDRANTCFALMKKSFLSLILAAVAGVLPAHAAVQWANEATRVVLSLDIQKAVQPEIMNLPQAPGASPFTQISSPLSSLKGDDMSLWYVVNIPVSLQAVGRDKDRKSAPARYVKELTVQTYLLFAKPKEKRTSKPVKDQGTIDKFWLIKKEITYVNIPTEKIAVKNENGHDVGRAEFSVAVFLPRVSCGILMGGYADFDKADEIKKPGHLVGYAVEATFNGEACLPIPSKKTNLPSGTTRNSKVFDSKLQKEFGNASWWKERKNGQNLEDPGVDVMSIAETPYAAFGGRFYPQVKPMYGSETAMPSPSASDASATLDGAESDTTTPAGAATRTSAPKTTTTKELPPAPEAPSLQ